PGASRCCWPQTSARVLGRRRWAKGSRMGAPPFFQAIVRTITTFCFQWILYSILRKRTRFTNRVKRGIITCRNRQGGTVMPRKQMPAAELAAKKELALEVIERLKAEYPDAACTLDYADAWQLLVSVRL